MLLTRILAPTCYIFFASSLPVVAFGEQLSKHTGIIYNAFFLYVSYISYKSVNLALMINI